MEIKKCDKCEQEIKAVEGIKIVSRYDSDKILFQSTKNTIKGAVEEAVKKNANLEGANLECANLRYANLKCANLRYANLKCAKTGGGIVNFTTSECAQAKQFIEGLKL